jgi:hypothetical protein
LVVFCLDFKFQGVGEEGKSECGEKKESFHGWLQFFWREDSKLRILSSVSV